MEKGKSRKSLLIGILAAIVVLAALLALVLTQCTPKQDSGAVETTAAPTEGVPTYDVYWNLDKDIYGGKSEAGMSSRKLESDGLFHIRFHHNGKVVELTTPDRRLVNKIDVMDLMGLVFDENGCIIDAVDVEELPLELVGFKFYVQSIGGNTIKLNSSNRMVGMEVLLEKDSETGIWDMSGVSGPKGIPAELTAYDRVICIQDRTGRLTHVFVYDRSDFMLTHEGECQHCKETVTWFEWTKEEELPNKSGHYQLMNDVTLKTQLSMGSDMKLCLDLNGHAIDGGKSGRLVSLHNVGAELALMDTSEEKTGRMVGHSTASPQGGIVWVRYGAFYLYGGTLDASDMTSRLNGTAVEIRKGAFFYMHDGTIIGGTSQAQPSTTTASGYAYGLAGAVSNSGTMRMYGGTIRDGKANAAYYYNDKGKLAVTRGMGGNLFLASGSVTELAGGRILNGYAGNCGGNICADGTAEVNISGTVISGGWSNAQVSGRHGGNIYTGGKVVINMTGGAITGGSNVTAAGGNICLNGTLNLYGGTIGYGQAATSGGNIHMGGSARLNMFGGAIVGGTAKQNAGNVNVSSKSAMQLYGGWIADGVAGLSGGNIACNTEGVLYMYGGTVEGGLSKGQAAGHGGGNIALVADKTALHISGGIVRNGKTEGLVQEDGTTLGGDGANINQNRGTVTVSGGEITGGQGTGNGDGIYVAWNTLGFTLSGEARIYGNGEADIVRSNNSAAGKSRIIIDGWKGNGDKGALRIGRVSGAAGALVASAAEDGVLTEKVLSDFTSANGILPLALDAKGQMILGRQAQLGQPDHTHCLCGGAIEGHACQNVGFVSVDAATFYQCWSGTTTRQLLGSQNLCLTEDVVLKVEHANMGGELNICLHGHTITMEEKGRLTSHKETGVLNITDCTGKGRIQAAEGCRHSFLYAYHGAINLYGGTVDGTAIKLDITDTKKDGAVVTVHYPEDTFTMYGGTILGGQIYRGGAVYAYQGTFVMRGGVISGGKAALGGNVATNYGRFEMYGGTITKGAATDGGGVGIGYNTTAAPILSGSAKIYGNEGNDLYLGQNPAGKVGFLTLDGWEGNGGQPMMVLSRNNQLGAVVAQAKEGQLTESDAAYFGYGHADFLLKAQDGKLVLRTSFVHPHCVCNGKLDHAHTIPEYQKISTAQEFDALFDSKNYLTAPVSIALTGDFTLTSPYYTNGFDLDICLNGHTVTMAEKARLYASGNGTLNITDCGEGRLEAAEGCLNSLLFASGGDINLYGGTVDASRISQSMAAADDKNGGALYVNTAEDTFTMYGGTVIGGTIYRGGALYAYKGNIVIRDGLVTGGTATIGGSVAVNYGTFEMTGGTITGGTATQNGALLAMGHQSKTAPILGGTSAIYGGTGPEEIYLGQNPAHQVNYLILDGWQGNGGEAAPVLAVRNADLGSVVAVAKEGQLAEEDIAKLNYPSDSMLLKLAEGKLVLEAIYRHSHCICDGTLDHGHGAVEFGKADTAEAFASYFDGSNNLTADCSISLTGDITLTAQFNTNGHVLSICLNGHTLTMSGKARLNSNGGGTLNITDCGTGAILAAEGCQNAFVYADGGNVNLYAGTLNAEKISHDITDKTREGGAVRVNTEGNTFTMYGGTIVGGTLYRGGAVYVNYGEFIMHGGQIYGGTADVGGNVATNRGDFKTMTGGRIHHGNANQGANVMLGYQSKTTLTLSGDARIYGGTGAEDVRLGQKPSHKVGYLILDGWQGNGADGALKLGLYSAEEGAVVAQAKEGQLTAEDAGKLSMAGTELAAVLTDGKLVLKNAHEHCICAGKLASDPGHTCEPIRFTEVTAEEFLSDTYWTEAMDGENKEYDLKASGNLCLTEPVTLSTEYRTNGFTLNLCLNGQTVTVSGSNARLTANGGGVLNITDCGDGSITAETGARHSFLYAYNGAVNLYGGTIDGTAVEKSMDKNDDMNGGVVTAYNAGDTFTMYGGKILGGKLYRGGALYAHKGSIVIRGGEITGGRATIGGNVAVNYGTLEISGGQIHGGTATTGAGVSVGYQSSTPLKISGDAKIYNNGNEDIHLNQKNAANRYLELDGWQGNGDKGAAKVTVNGAVKDTVIAVAKEGTLTADDAAKLAYSDQDYGTMLNADGKIALLQHHRHCLCVEGTLAGGCTADHAEAIYTPVSSQAELVAALQGESPIHIYVAADFTIEGDNVFVTGKTVDLCLNDKTVTMKKKIAVTEGGVLNITACGGGQLKSGGINQLLIPGNGTAGAVTLYAGTLDASAYSGTSKGGAVYVKSSGNTNLNASFTMYGGHIIGAAKVERGGGVHVESGYFYMHGGKISGGYATTYGGGVGVNAGSMYMTGGEITGCSVKAGATGGGVNIGHPATEFVISGNAAIHGNYIAETAGNVPSDVHMGNAGSASGKKYYLVVDGWQGNGVDENGTPRPVLHLSHAAAAADKMVAAAREGKLAESDLAKLTYVGGVYDLVLNADGMVVLKAK